MNIHSKWRLDFANHLSKKLMDYPDIEAILVAGSVARGYSDHYSDLEIILYWNHVPESDIRHAIFQKLNAEYRYPKIDHGHESALRIHGFPIDLWQKTLHEEESIMDKVLHTYSTDLAANNVLDTVMNGIPLYGAEIIDSWKKVVAQYPVELSNRFLKEYLPHFHLRQLYFAMHRNNPTAFYHILSNIQSSLFLILLALNQSYFPTFKWVYKRLAELPLVPANIESKLRQMFHEPPKRAASQLHGVLTETLAIVEKQFPNLDTTFAQYGLDQELPKSFEHAPSYKG